MHIRHGIVACPPWRAALVARMGAGLLIPPSSPPASPPFSPPPRPASTRICTHARVGASESAPPFPGDVTVLNSLLLRPAGSAGV